MACDMPEPYKFLSRDSCQKRVLWTYRELSCSVPSRWSSAPSRRYGQVGWTIWLTDRYIGYRVRQSIFMLRVEATCLRENRHKSFSLASSSVSD